MSLRWRRTLAVWRLLISSMDLYGVSARMYIRLLELTGLPIQMSLLQSNFASGRFTSCSK